MKKEIHKFDPIIDLKHIRAHVIRDYLYEKDKYNNKVVCFSCGNASRALKDVGLDVLDIGEHGDLKPNHWFTQKEISEIFSNRFDATCGHLNMELMNELSLVYKDVLKEYMHQNRHKDYWVPTGSGETLVCLKMAFPEKNFHAVYNIDDATRYNNNAPLNQLVRLLATTIKFQDLKEDTQDETDN